MANGEQGIEAASGARLKPHFVQGGPDGRPLPHEVLRLEGDMREGILAAKAARENFLANKGQKTLDELLNKYEILLLKAMFWEETMSEYRKGR